MKGSFPLDHEGACKETMIAYMLCLNKNEQRNDLCREEAKIYFECRMAVNLMHREDWSTLGYDVWKTINFM